MRCAIGSVRTVQSSVFAHAALAANPDYSGDDERFILYNNGFAIDHYTAAWIAERARAFPLLPVDGGAQ